MFRFAFYLSVYGVLFCAEGMAIQVTNPFKPGSTVVNIGGNVKTLTRSTSCKAKNWGNVQENACTCCIVKSAIRSGGKIQYGGNPVPYCLKKKHCTDETLQTIGESVGISYNSNFPQAFTNKVIANSLSISNSGTLAANYYSGSSLKPEGVIAGLSRLAKQGKIKHSSRDLHDCFYAEPIGGGGSQTLQLFKISKREKCGGSHSGQGEDIYIVKELKKTTEEIKNTTLIKNSILGQYNLSNPTRPQNFPAIALDETSFIYQDTKGKPHYLAVLPMAQGDSIFNILKVFAESYKKHQGEGSLSSPEYKNSLVRAQHAMMALGSQLGRLHATHMSRDKKGRLSGKSQAVHGDMHANNIFEDIDHNIIFIDAETFAIGIKSPRSIGKDLLRIYLFSTIRSSSKQNPGKGKVGQTYWHEEIIKPFLLEYVRSYALLGGTFNQQNLDDIMQILRKTFSLSGSASEAEGFFLKAGPLKSLWAYRKYINKILIEIESELRKNPNTGGLSMQAELFLKNKPLKKIRKN